MERAQFLSRLELAAPALSTADTIAVMSHFWFTGKRVIAYNDRICIATPLKTDFEGTLPGNTLLSLARASRAEKLGLTVEDDQAILKLASTKSKLPHFKKDAFVFDPPDPPVVNAPVDPWVQNWKLFFASLDSCMRSVGHDTSHPDYMGITLIPEGKLLHMYATNDTSMSHAVVPTNGKVKFERAIIGPEFCAQLLNLSKRDAMLSFNVHDDHAVFTTGKTVLWGSLIDHKDQGSDFKAMFEKFGSEKKRQKAVEIPSKLKLIIERAMVISESKVERALTHILSTDGKLRFFTKSEARGEITDYLGVGLEHNDVEIAVQPRAIDAGLDFFERILFTSGAVIMVKGDMTYLISAGEG